MSNTGHTHSKSVCLFCGAEATRKLFMDSFTDVSACSDERCEVVFNEGRASFHGRAVIRDYLARGESMELTYEG